MNAKKLVSGCMAAFLLAGCAAGMTVQAKAKKQPVKLDQNDPYTNAFDTNAYNTNALQTDYYEVETIETKGKLSFKAAQQTSDYRLSESEWADSGCNYYFRQLNTLEKKLYLNLKTQADIYLTGADNFQTTTILRDGQQVQTPVLPMVSYQGMDTAQMKKVFSCFYFENPQYYFMRNAVIYSEKKEVMTIGLYQAFADGSQRQKYTGELAAKLFEWDEQISQKETTVEKERLIHQIVCEHTEYDYTRETVDADDARMSQSCISAILFDRTTLCNGYAQFFSLLCNRAGIRCVTVTSEGHAWNKVCMGNIWYNVDCTWDDSRGDEKFFNTTDVQLRIEDSIAAEHTESEEWKGVAPSCEKAFDEKAANGKDTGADVPAPGKAAEFSVTANGKGKALICFTKVDGCDGYSLQYAQNSSFNGAKKKTSESAEFELTGLASGKTYYFRARAYVLDQNGENVYGAYAKKVKAAVL